MPIDESREFVALTCAVVTVSDTRTLDTDKSGKLAEGFLLESGHRVKERVVVTDNREAITRAVAGYVDDVEVDVVVTTGGTGVTPRDVTPEAVESLITKPIPGFGELFRMLSYETIGTSTIQSRATAGLCGRTFVFVLPGSSGAVRDAFEKILVSQLDNRHRPCNFAELMPRIRGEREDA